MSSRIALPFLVLPDEVVRFGGWMIGPPGEPLTPASDILEDWDYEQDIQINALVEVDFSKAATSLGISASEMRLAVTLVAGTGVGSLPRRLDRLSTHIIDESNPVSTLDGVMLGRSLSGQLQLGLIIALDSPLDSGNPLSPKRKGARLWQSQKNILIEDGGDSRFPIELASFSDSFPGCSEQCAPWLVDWNPDAFEADFGGNVRLYVNADIESVSSRFVDGDTLILQVMVADVMTQMIDVALDLDGEEELTHFEEGSIGHQVRVWIDNAFPGQSLDSIRQLRTYKPGRFRASILASADLGENE
ncbi:hypothetical protein ACI2KO_00060 [Pseudomonas piscis]|uniref:hypothetical protein n=1 Tax=Pseudomonas piscis TaxID=2614538 RepID=UPI00384D4DCD